MPEPSPRAARDAAGFDQDAVYVPPEDLGGAVATSLKWKLSAQVVKEATRLTTAIVLARLLTPGEWGLATMALVFAPLLLIVPDSISGGLVQRVRVTERDRSTVFWAALALGASMCVLGIAASGTIARIFGEPEVANLFKAVSVGFVITSLAVVPESLLMRDLAYRSLETRQMVATVMGASVALSIAFAGGGPWAIIGNSLAVATTSAAMVWWFVRWRPRMTFSSSSLRRFGGFGIGMFGSQALTYAQLNADKILVGRFLGATSLGTYAFAFNLMFTPILNIAFPLQSVLFPAYSTIQEDDDRLRATWLRGKQLTVAVLAPAFLILLVVAPDLVHVVFGAKWEDAIPVLQLLCAAGVAYSLSTQNLTLLFVLDRMSTVVRWNAVVLTTVVLAILVGLQRGVVGVAGAYAVAYWLLIVPEMWITTRSASIRLWPTLRTVGASLPLALAATAAAYALREVLVGMEVPPAARLMLVTVALPSMYVGLLLTAAPGLRKEAAHAIRRFRGRDTWSSGR